MAAPNRKNITATVTRTSQYGVQVDGRNTWLNYSRDYTGYALEVGTRYHLTYEEAAGQDGQKRYYILNAAEDTGQTTPAVGGSREWTPEHAPEHASGASMDSATVGRITYLSCLSSAATFLAGVGEDVTVLEEVARQLYRSTPGAPAVDFTPWEKQVREAHEQLAAATAAAPDNDEIPF